MSYAAFRRWRHEWELNPRPTGQRPVALPPELSCHRRSGVPLRKNTAIYFSTTNHVAVSKAAGLKWLVLLFIKLHLPQLLFPAKQLIAVATDDLFLLGFVAQQFALAEGTGLEPAHHNMR